MPTVLPKPTWITPTRPGTRQRVPARLLTTLALGGSVAACAATLDGQAPRNPAPASSQPGLTQAGTGCGDPAASGGAAPPAVVDADLNAAVARIAQPHAARPLTAESADRLRRALCDAGLWQRPGLDRALAPWGLSIKQIATLAPAPAVAAPAAQASAPGRRIPPREGAARP